MRAHKLGLKRHQKILIDFNMTKKHNKGQMAGQVFIYITAIIVIGVIALIGYNAIDKIVKKSCDADQATFKLDLENEIESRTSDGSIYPEKLNAPCDYDTICFVDASFINDPQKWSGFTCAENSIIKDSVKQGIQQNIFVISNKQTKQLGYSELISISGTDSNKCLCITERNKKFYITFSGRGISTEISAT
jgi:hypothetical protein